MKKILEAILAINLAVLSCIAVSYTHLKMPTILRV